MRTLACSIALLTVSLSTIGVRAQVAGDGQSVASDAGGIARFVEKGVDAAKFSPSLALARPMEVKFTGPVGADVKATPLFWTDKDGKHCVRIDIDAGTSLYGTGEIAGPLLRNGRKTVCWNTDAHAYTEENPSLYQSHPWVLAVRADGTAFGVLADTTWRCEIDLSGEEKGPQADGSIVFRGEGAAFPAWVIDRASPQDVMKGLGELIGTLPLPPKWAIGYHQCRYSYYPEAKVREIAEGFRSRKIPCDVIWFDVDSMDGFRIFTYDKGSFPDPKGLNADLEAKGFHRIWMIDPGVKAEPGYSVYDQLTAKDFSVKNAKGEVYKGELWPGWCVYPDYTRPDVRAWWAGLYKGFMALGVSGVGNDMNEPAVFNVKSKTMPDDNTHTGGAWEGGTLPPGPHLQYHNVYGMLMAKGTFDGIKAAKPDKRPFVLTRAGYIGSQRVAATWTGDNSATWADLENSVSMAANLGLSGQPFCGPDIGGFNGNGNGAMFARWMGIGSLLPFCRGQTGKGNIDKEPWAFGPEVEQACKLALERRYRLLPYLYTLFHEASVSGMPVMRPVFFADPKDAALRSEDDAFMLGSDLLVVPRLTPDRDRAPILPKGIWNQVTLVDEGEHPDLPRLLVRGGAIVPLGPVIQHADEKQPEDKPAPLTLLVSLDDAGNAAGTLYEDEGDGFAYAGGQYLLTTYVARTLGEKVTIEIADKQGKMLRRTRDLRVMLVKDGWFYVAAGTDGQALTLLPKMMTPLRFEMKPPSAPKAGQPMK